MTPGRRLLYHRGIDDSVGTYITDYVLFGQCLIFLTYYFYLFVKHRDTPTTKNGSAKSTYAVAFYFFLIGMAALIGGLAHQFLQTVEPYTEFRDNMTWLIIWRVAAALSGSICFVSLLLSEHLLSSEKMIPKLSRTAFILYYIIVGLICVGITGHSFWMLNEQDPWSLSITFVLVFACSFIQLIAATAACGKHYRFRSSVSLSSKLVTSYDPVQSSSFESESNNEKSDKQVNQTKAQKALNNNTSPILPQRTDLLLHFLSPLIFLIGGGLQFALARVGNCGQHHKEGDEVRCPLPDEFNHNSLFHLFQYIVMATYFAAELYAVRRRQTLSNQLTSQNGAQETA